MEGAGTTMPLCHSCSSTDRVAEATKPFERNRVVVAQEGKRLNTSYGLQVNGTFAYAPGDA